MRGVKELTVKDSDKGEISPISGATAPDKPQKTGRKRRRWRNKKKQATAADTGNQTASSGTEPLNKLTADRLPNCETKYVASLQAVRGTSKHNSNISPDGINSLNPHQGNAEIQGLGIKKKSRRKRHRRRAKNSTSELNASPSTNDEANNEGSSEESLRHRRQPMSREKRASFKDTVSGKQQSGNSGQDQNKHSNTLGQSHNQYRPAFHQNRSKKFYAALDLGTNNCRLLVAVPQGPGRFRVVDAFSRIVRLGEGLGSSGKLSDAAMDRTIEALKVCRDKLNQRSHTRHRLIATEACRRAENGEAFLDRVREEAGLDLEIVDRETEARLAVSGCGSLVDHKAHGVVLFDIGGGSSELALLDISKRRSRRLSDHIASWTSLPLGVVTLSEKFGGGKNVTPQIFEDMVVEVTNMLDQYEGRGALSHALESGRFHLLGTSGTVTTLAGVHLNLRRYDRRRVDGTWLSDQEVDAMINRILNMSFEDRVNNPCIGADRADLVLAGCAILEAIRRLWPSPRLRVADRGLREGLLTEMMAEDGVWRRNRRRSNGHSSNHNAKEN